MINWRHAMFWMNYLDRIYSIPPAHWTADEADMREGGTQRGLSSCRSCSRPGTRTPRTASAPPARRGRTAPRAGSIALQSHTFTHYLSVAFEDKQTNYIIFRYIRKPQSIFCIFLIHIKKISFSCPRGKHVTPGPSLLTHNLKIQLVYAIILSK